VETSSERRCPAWAERGLVVAGVGAVLVALFHAAAIFTPALSEPSPGWRHALFVGINLFFAFAFLTRARWLPVPFAVLSVQQLWSHGRSFLAAGAAGHLDAQSLAVLVTLPVLAVVVGMGRKRPGSRPKAAGGRA